ncbi:MAG TPA: hypothetical protein DDZ51_05535 [Planctomycetaceae bacterium]|nr:hypothetical protein [Planctomycetaceae bacterium]
MSNPIIGKDCQLVYDEIADWAAPTWVPIPNAVDVSQPGITKNMVDLPSRGTAGWNPKGAGLKSMDLTFGYLYHSGTDAIFAALRDAFLQDTVLAFAVLDGPGGGIVGRTVQGFKFPGIVSEFPISEELEDGRRIEIKVDFARHVLAGTLLLPTWVSIAALT